jgi:integrase
LLDKGLRVGELCGLASKDILWQQRQLRFKGKGGPHGKKTKVRVVPMSNRVRTLLEHHFALEKAFPVKARRAQDIVKAVANRAGITTGWALPCNWERSGSWKRSSTIPPRSLALSSPMSPGSWRSPT